MKKSKIISIGLLALSIAACHKKHKSNYNQWNQSDSTNTQYYIDDGTGYHQGGISPVWIYWMLLRQSNGGYSSSPGYVYRSYGSRGTGSFHNTEFGVRTTISRGGFGHSGSHAGS